MQHAAIDLVTVSREYGAGGSDFASLLGERLRWPVLDKNLVERVAQRLNMEAEAVQHRDEQPPGWLSRIASTLLISPPEAPLQVETDNLLMPDSIAHAAHDEIVRAAASPPLIVVGHGAQLIFGEREHTLHVRLVGTPESRVARLVARNCGTPEQAALDIRRIDGERHAYVQRYYHQYWADPLLFNILFNTDRVSIDEAVACTARIIASSEQPRTVRSPDD